MRAAAKAGEGAGGAACSSCFVLTALSEPNSDILLKQATVQNSCCYMCAHDHTQNARAARACSALAVLLQVENRWV